MSLPLSPLPRSSRLLDEWSWLTPAGLEPFWATPVGDLFLKAADGNVYFLDTLGGKLIDAADSESDLLAQLQDEALAADIFMPELSRQLSTVLGALDSGKCFSAIIPLSLNGQLLPSNFRVSLLEEHVRSMGRLQQQVANDPQGTRYKPAPGQNGA